METNDNKSLEYEPFLFYSFVGLFDRPRKYLGLSMTLSSQRDFNSFLVYNTINLKGPEFNPGIQHVSRLD